MLLLTNCAQQAKRSARCDIRIFPTNLQGPMRHSNLSHKSPGPDATFKSFQQISEAQCDTQMRWLPPRQSWRQATQKIKETYIYIYIYI